MPTATPSDVKLYVPNTPLTDTEIEPYIERAERERAERDLQRAYDATGADYSAVDAADKTDIEATQTAIILLSIPGDDRSTDSVSLGDWSKSYSASALAELKDERDSLVPDAVAKELKGNRNTNRYVGSAGT